MNPPPRPLAVDALRRLMFPGATIALGDGVGTVTELSDDCPVGPALSRLARDVGDIRLVAGWLPTPVRGLDTDAFRDIVALMPGWGARTLLRGTKARFLPTRLSAVSAVLSGGLRPDLLLTRVALRDNTYHFTTEVSWQRELVRCGVPVAAIIDSSASVADAGPGLDPSSVHVVGHCHSGPASVSSKAPEPVHGALADAVLAFVPPGARLQYGPGQLGTALLDRIGVPVHIDTGLLTDAIVGLDRRGLLLGVPSATYLLGTDTLYGWADGQPILNGIEYTHDLTRLASDGPLIAVNTAIEIDEWGQINVEGVGSKIVGGIGGHPDFCLAGATSRDGLSIIAVPSYSGSDRRSPLVSQLSRPVSTPAFDIDVIVTEHGHADLRGADWDGRRALITELFEERARTHVV